MQTRPSTWRLWAITSKKSILVYIRDKGNFCDTRSVREGASAGDRSGGLVLKCRNCNNWNSVLTIIGPWTLQITLFGYRNREARSETSSNGHHRFHGLPNHPPVIVMWFPYQCSKAILNRGSAGWRLWKACLSGTAPCSSWYAVAVEFSRMLQACGAAFERSFHTLEYSPRCFL
jgi:hypothetical protein